MGPVIFQEFNLYLSINTTGTLEIQNLCPCMATVTLYFYYKRPLAFKVIISKCNITKGIWVKQIPKVHNLPETYQEYFSGNDSSEFKFVFRAVNLLNVNKRTCVHGHAYFSLYIFLHHFQGLLMGTTLGKG